MSAAIPMTVPEMISTGRVDDAVRTLNSRVQSSPNDAEAYHLLSRAYYRLKKWDQAIANGEKAVELHPNNSEYQLWLGRAYGEKADNSSFIPAVALAKKLRGSFEKAVARDGKNIE
jgi:cytochrome c-type biogenesis protein CcmH/NrfG